MNALDRLIGLFSPTRGLARAQARAALGALAQYDVMTRSNRNRSWRAPATDADAAASGRLRAAWIARDMVRNTPLATRVREVIGNNVVGDGIVPKLTGATKAVDKALREAVIAHLESTDIDADGRLNIYGLQRMAVTTMVESGEILIRRVRRARADRMALPFQIQLLEPDFIDTDREEVLVSGAQTREGISFDAQGRRTGYWLFDRHPGSPHRLARGYTSRFVPASEILHLYRPDRPGQIGGVSWFAPIAMSIQDLADLQDAQLMRQKIAACFAAFRITPDADPTAGTSQGLEGLDSIEPGRVELLSPGEDIRFSSPPAAEGFGEFNRAVLHSVAAGVGVTYEALTGDLSRVSFISGRMGRLEMDRNMSAIQWLFLIPQFLAPLGRWCIEAWAQDTGLKAGAARLTWVPPARPMLSPRDEVAAQIAERRAGFRSRQDIIRARGDDPAEVMAEIEAEDTEADRMSAVFDSDPRRTTNAGQAQLTASGGSDQAGAANGE